MSIQFDRDELSFLDGYLFRVLVEMLASHGTQESGLYDFYRARIQEERSALSGYDYLLFNYIDANFDRARRRVLHAGIGVGTLSCALALGGFTVCGVERDQPRFAAASRIRWAFAQVWPAAAERYELLNGTFPAATLNSPWVSRDTVLVFTNCGSGWSDDFTAGIVGLFPLFGDVILDARLFGRIRDTTEERQELISMVAGLGLTATPLVETHALGAYYHHIQPFSEK